VLESGFGLDSGPKKDPILVQLAAIVEDKKEVVMKTTMRKQDLSEKVCQDMFDRFDANKSGEIDIRELEALTRALGLSLSREALNNSMFELDTNRNGAISFDEFWTWWQIAAVVKGGGVSSPPMTGGGSANKMNRSRPVSQQSSRFSGGLSRPGSRGSALGGLSDLKGAILGEIDDAFSQAGSTKSNGRWLTNNGIGRPVSQMSSRPSRPGTRNSQRSVAGQDYCPPPLLSRPPRLHGLRHIQMNLPPRPATAPVDPFNPAYVRVPGTPAVPKGVTTGYVL